MSTNSVLFCDKIYKTYRDADREIPVLIGLDLQIKQGERVAIIGKSGTGKTTLINLLGGLERPSAGEIYYDGTDIHKISDRERGHLRNRLFGFIFQFHHLLPEFTALENVAMPLLLRKDPISLVKKLSQEALEQVGLGHRLTHKPNKLSGGERQRVAIARALVTKPQCVLADEPTGNLDQENAALVYELMLRLTEEVGTSFVIVTHDHDLAAKMDRIVQLDLGKLQVLKG